MDTTIQNFAVYKIPSESILQKRIEFYKLQRKSEESIENWLDRVEYYISYCKFPEFVEYLAIDKFMCKLKSYELKDLRNLGNTWTLKQLNEYFNNRNVHVVSTSPYNASDEIVDEKIDEKLATEAIEIKCEIVSGDSGIFHNKLAKFGFWLLLSA